MYNFPAADPAATPVLTINMVKALPPGVTVASAIARVLLASGADPNASALTGTVDASGATTTPFPVKIQWKAGGLPGRIYIVSALCVGSDSEIYVGSGLLPIVPGGA